MSDQKNKATREDITYRVQGIPSTCDRKRAKALLETALGFDEGESDIRVHSLAISAHRKDEKTGTITSSRIAERLSGAKSQWSFEAQKQSTDSDDENPNAPEITIDTHFEGFTALNSFDEPCQHRFDCIGICGLGGHAFGSFKERGGRYMWLRDALPNDLKGARIFIYGYNTKLADSKSFQDLEALASTFRRALVSVRRQQDSQEKPLFFIAHSLGGLILKEMFVQLKYENNIDSKTVMKATYGILFFGCPNQGMNISSLIPICNGQANLLFLLSLRQNSERLRQLCRDFPTAFAFPDSQIISFYETELSPTAIEGPDGIWTMSGPLDVLVGETSATHGRPGEDKAHNVQAISRNHSELVKFSRRDLNYDIVLGFLQDFATSACEIIKARFTVSDDGTDEPGRFRFSEEATLPPCLSTERPDSYRLGLLTHNYLGTHPPFMKYDRYGEVIRWLAPTTYECDHYRDDLESAQESRHPGTCQWICKKSEFVNWSKASSPLWIYAIPGAGKTVLTSYLIDHLTKDGLPDTAVLYFFFKHADTDKNTPLAAARALIHQLLQFSCMTKKDEFYNALLCQVDNGGQARAVSFRALWDFFCRHCAKLPNLTIVLDALDECLNVAFLLPGLLKLVKQGSARVICTSRREPDLIAELKGIPSLDMGPEEVRHDINAYLEYAISHSPTLSDPRIQSRIIRMLNARSKGMFLWVVLMIKELESKISIDEIEDALLALPDGLEEVYERILKSLSANLKPSRRIFCCKVLKWITLAKRALRLDEIHEALKLEYGPAVGKAAFAQNLLYSGRELELACGSLIMIRNKTVQLIHLSAKEFLQMSPETLQLDSQLRDFLVEVGVHSAELAAHCTVYLAAHCVPKTKLLEDTSEKSLTAALPLIEYASFNWLSHIVESDIAAVAKHESKMRPFLQSRTSFRWIEICFSIHLRSCSRLRMMVQTLLNWLFRESRNASPTQEVSLEESKSLLQYWAESYMQLLIHYGPALESRPFEVHNIDPARIFPPSDHKFVDTFQKSGLYHRHIILQEARSSTEFIEVQANRCLQRYTSSSEYYGFFHADQRRGVFITVDRATQVPKIYCQEIATGRKLLPVVDMEFEEGSNLLEFIGASMSPDGNYLGIVYCWVEDDSPYTSSCITYTAVWVIQKDLNFQQELNINPWARKVISVTARGHAFLGSPRPIVFDNDRSVYCPNGRIDLTTGIEEMPPALNGLEDDDTVIYSGDGQSLIHYISNLGMLRFIRFAGDTEDIGLDVKDIVPYVKDFSYRGRYIAWIQGLKLYIHDTVSSITNELASLLDDQVGDCDLIFTEDEKMLVGIFGVLDRQDGRGGATSLLVWMIQDSTAHLSARRNLPHGEPLGFSLVEKDKYLYIVLKDRTWSRIDLNTKELSNLDSGVEAEHFNRAEHQISMDGTRLAILRLVFGQAHIQIFDLADSGKMLLERVLDLPEANFETSIVMFSPDLELLFIGGLLFGLQSQSSDVKRMSLPIPNVQVSQVGGHTIWHCGFSACSTFFAAVSNPPTLGEFPPRLHLFAIDKETWSVRPSLFNNSSLLVNFGGLRIAFHPQRHEIVLCAWHKEAPVDHDEPSSRMEYHQLDLESLAYIRPPYSQVIGTSLIRSTEFMPIFSACGTYILLLLRSQSFLSSPLPLEVPLHSRPSVLQKDEIGSWGGYKFSFYEHGRDSSLHIAVSTLDHTESVHLGEMKHLTVVPEYLKGARKALLLGDEKHPQLRVLFLRENAPPEMKFLDLTLEEHLSQYDTLAGSNVIKGVSELEDPRND